MSFLGKEGFIWWIGVVEDRFDPLYLGRCKVRILGWHTKDKTSLPTKNLPWCSPIQPITSAAQTGVGISPTGVVEGSWVFGFYRDGNDAQEPMMLGTMGGIPQSVAELNQGFNDPRADIEYIPLTFSDTLDVIENKQELINVPRDPVYLPENYDGKDTGAKATILNRGEGGSDTEISTYPDARYVTRKEPTTPRLARGIREATAHNTVSSAGQFRPLDGLLYAKDLSRITNVKRARGGATGDDEKFDEPSIQFQAIYPYNHVHQSESGHVLEIDDTPKQERLHWFHRSGTYVEMQNDGNHVTKSVGDTYNLTYHNSFEAVKNEKVSTISGGYELFVNERGIPGNDYYLKVGKQGNAVIETQTGNILLNAGRNNIILNAGEIQTNFSKNVATTTTEDYTIASRNYSSTATGNTEISTDGKLLLKGTPINMSSDGTMTATGQVFTQSFSETSVENLQSSLLSVPKEYAKEVNAVFGKVKIESVDSVATGGIEINTGLAGKASQMKFGLKGDITLTSLLGNIETNAKVGDITTSADAGKIETVAKLGDINITATGGEVTAEAKAKNVNIKAGVTVDVNGTQTVVLKGGTAVYLGKDQAQEPIILGKKFIENFTKHFHATGSGPSGPVENAGICTQTLSKKVFGS